MVFAEKREIKFITIYILAMLFLGISRPTTKFIFPDQGDNVFTVINFYFISAVALIAAIAWLSQAHNIPSLPKIPPTWAIGVNFLIFFPIFYIGLHLIFTGSASVSIPKLATFVIEAAISFNENFIAFILLPTLLPWGKGVGSVASGNITTIRDYTLRYDIPTFSRLLYGLPSIITITLLHVGSYSYSVSNFNDFYFVMVIAFIAFYVMYFIKETVGFGASEAAHLSWNLTVLTPGSIIKLIWGSA